MFQNTLEELQNGLFDSLGHFLYVIIPSTLSSAVDANQASNEMQSGRGPTHLATPLCLDGRAPRPIKWVVTVKKAMCNLYEHEYV